jgi:hypothetical protein
VAVYTDNGGEPDGEIANGIDTLTVSTITDVVSEWVGLDLSTMADLTATTKYHVVVNGALGDNAANHWEVGVNKNETGSMYSSDGSVWSEAEFRLYHRVVGADVNRKWHMQLTKG